MIAKADEPTIRELKEKLIIANKILDKEGLTSPMGHISVRVPGTETFLITRIIAPGMATIDDVVVCNMEGEVVEGKHPRTYGEVVGHTAVYKKFKDIHSVTHTHSPHVIALSMTGATLLPASMEAMKVGSVGFYKKIMYLESPEVGEEVAGLIGLNRAVILRGHGAVVAGGSIEETTIVALYLERAAKLQMWAHSAGKLMIFTDKEVKQSTEFIRKMESKGGTSSHYGRAWEYYKSLVEE